jgi:hypothetical protein
LIDTIAMPNDKEHFYTLKHKHNYQNYFYNFDKTISSIDTRNYSRCEIDNMYTNNILSIVFGGPFRLKELVAHFRLLNAKGVQLYILTDHNAKNIKYIMDLMNLSQYFSGICYTKNKLYSIIQILNSNDLQLYDGLLIDNSKDIINIAPYMQAYYITDKINGMNSLDMTRLFNL